MIEDFINYIFGDNDKAQGQSRLWLVVRGILWLTLLSAIGSACLCWIIP